MNDLQIFDKNNKKINADLFFSFIALGKKYIVLNYDFSIFKNDSKYNDFNVFAVVEEYQDKLFVSNIPDDDWPKIKDFLNQEIFSKI